MVSSMQSYFVLFSLSFLTTTLGGGGGGAKDFCIPHKEKGENLFFLRPTIYTQKIFCSGNFFKVLFISQKRVWMMKDFFARRKSLRESSIIIKEERGGGGGDTKKKKR